MDFFRRNEKLIVWMIVIIIIPVFGIGGLLTALSKRPGSHAYGTLEGEEVTVAVLRDFMSRYGIANPRTDKEVEAVIQFYAQVEKTKRSGFHISESEILAIIKDRFKDGNGDFDSAGFQKTLKRMEMSEQVYIERIEEESLMRKYRSILKQLVPVSNDEILFRYHQDRDKYKIKYAMIPVEKLPKEEIPSYDEIQEIYETAKGKFESGDENKVFFEDFPIRDDLVKQWVIVRYIAISNTAIEENLDIDEVAIIDYYEKNKDKLYRIEEPEKEEKDTEKKKATAYRPLNKKLTQSIGNILTGKEAERIAKELVDKVNEKMIEVEDRGEIITLKELAKHNYFNEIKVSESFIKREGKIVYSGLSDPVELPGNFYSSIIIDKRAGSIPPDWSRFQRGGSTGKSDWDKAFAALIEPTPDIPTQFFKTHKGYCMFVPEWWPNKDIQGTSARGVDITFIVPFPDKETVGIKEDKSDEEGHVDEDMDTKEEESKSLLDLKIENMTENTGIKLYQKIKKFLKEKKAKENAWKRAEELYQELTIKDFDEIAKKNDAEVKTEPFQTLRDGGESVEACYTLEPSKGKSEIFLSKYKEKDFYGIGYLLESKIADESNIPQEEIDKIKNTIAEEKSSDFETLMDIYSTLEWVKNE